MPVATVMVVLALTGLSACAEDGPADDDGGAGAAPEMEHIHGIGVDPEDGVVYVGTHHGLFRLEDGSPVRVADREQDFMGFTVAGPQHFLAGGHPGEGQEGPSSVGLIESTDGGETWTVLSLAAEADFHALEYRHGRVYGLNAMTGQLLMSSDRKTWQELSSNPIADFAVSPDDAEVLLATTEDGLAQSTDGGANFQVLSSAPVMVFIGWSEDGTVAGVTPEGTVFTAEKPDGEWTERGDLGGAPEALAVESRDQIYAAANGTVLLSTDEGETFSAALNQ